MKMRSTSTVCRITQITALPWAQNTRTVGVGLLAILMTGCLSYRSVSPDEWVSRSTVAGTMTLRDAAATVQAAFSNRKTDHRHAVTFVATDSRMQYQDHFRGRSQYCAVAKKMQVMPAYTLKADVAWGDVEYRISERVDHLTGETVTYCYLKFPDKRKRYGGGNLSTQISIRSDRHENFADIVVALELLTKQEHPEHHQTQAVSPKTRLQQLQELRDEGLISDDAYEEKQRRILESL